MCEGSTAKRKRWYRDDPDECDHSFFFKELLHIYMYIYIFAYIFFCNTCMYSIMIAYLLHTCTLHRAKRVWVTEPGAVGGSRRHERQF